MSSSAPKVSWPRATVEKEEILSLSMEAAFLAGARAATLIALAEEGRDIPTDEDLTAACRKLMEEVNICDLDHRLTLKKSFKKTQETRAPKKPSPKKPPMSDDLSTKDFNPSCCKARQWNTKDSGSLATTSAGHGAQCWRLPEEDGDGYCKICVKRMDDDTQANWGDFNLPLDESPGYRPDGTDHPWAALKKEKVEKVEKVEKDGEKKKKNKMEKKAEKKAEKKKEAEEKKAKKEAEAEAKKAAKKAAAEAKEAEAKEAEAKAEAIQDEPCKDGSADALDEKEEDESFAETLDEIAEKQAGESDEGTLDLDESGDDLSEETPDKVEEYDHNGFTLLWNKKTNELTDPDDSELLGKMVEEDGKWIAQLDEDSSEGESSDEEE
jgi:flagellar biosynthesis GTPase FlhF